MYMTRCPRCGERIPREKDVKFCPNCGASILASVTRVEVRVALIVVLLILCVFATAIGASTKIEVEEARRLNRELNNLSDAAKTIGPQVIFGNNFMHALIMFVPVAGPCWGFYVLYNTGRFIAALSTTEGISPTLTMLTLFFFPFTWMEYISYALAISESLFLAYSIIKRDLKREFAVASSLIVLCSIILLIAAFIEFSLISLLEIS
ncbi:MAG: zinc ribbon domain-containing protein [Candidatus Bathyarchaeia archaeon]